MAEKDLILQGVHDYSKEDSYVIPKEPQVREKLEWFMDQKLALMMHWGPYSQPGLVESWALIDEDESWSRNEVDWTQDIDSFKETYVHLNETFNPIRFEPEKWARFAKETGFRYLIFTTKHHDGFCMWDTQTTDYKITADDCPFHSDPRADIVRHVFDAFRAEGLGIAAYFSKADWHTPYYWKEGALHGFTRRGPSYIPSEDPETWEAFVQYTHAQLRELADDYGPLDILWLDAGWVRASNDQDIRLGEIVDELRTRWPGLISADRTVGGPYENYITPEQCIPEEPLFVPWESCITMGSAFSFRYEDTYKSARTVAGLLLQIISKGGNLALNVAPQPDGRLSRQAMVHLKEFGMWLNTHAEGIFETRPVAPYASGPFYFTRNRKTGRVYAFRFFEDAGEPVDPVIQIPYNGSVSEICLLETGEVLAFQKHDSFITIEVPSFPQTPFTLTFRITP